MPPRSRAADDSIAVLFPLVLLAGLDPLPIFFFYSLVMKLVL
uniref:Uncharacterized protein n=1 Tax=Arundo donax TaxID=35708 RepID=A0A0A9C446_ARUDO